MQKRVIFGSGHEEEVVSAKVGDALIWKEYFAKLLGILIHFDLSFTKHVKVISRKAWKSLQQFKEWMTLYQKKSE